VIAAVDQGQVVYLVGEVEFISREEALDAIGDRPATLTEVTGSSSWSVPVRTQACPDCGLKYRTEGVLALMVRPCGCGGAS
jgi:hypothetical protein